jgi:hypothetical protein
MPDEAVYSDEPEAEANRRLHRDRTGAATGDDRLIKRMRVSWARDFPLSQNSDCWRGTGRSRQLSARQRADGTSGYQAARKHAGQPLLRAIL